MNPEISESSKRTLRIDFHVHLAAYDISYPWLIEWIKKSHKAGYDEYVKRYSDPGQFEELLSEQGIDYACILAELNPITTGICSNEQVEAFCRGRKRLIPFCDINPNLHNDLAAELRKKVEVHGFKGLKLYPTYQHYYLNDIRMYPLYQTAQELKIPVLIHTGSSIFKGTRLKYGDPLHLDDVAVDFPNLNLIMAHAGRGFWYDRAFFLSKLHRNVYMEISGLPPSKLLTYFPEFTRNTDKIIFGSDWPGMPDIKENMDVISKLDLPPGGADKILGATAAKLLQLK